MCAGGWLARLRIRLQEQLLSVDGNITKQRDDALVEGNMTYLQRECTGDDRYKADRQDQADLLSRDSTGSSNLREKGDIEARH